MDPNTKCYLALAARQKVFERYSRYLPNYRFYDDSINGKVVEKKLF